MLRGTTHRNDIGATSVVTYVVSPSMRLEGMNARRIHRPRLQTEIDAAGSSIARLSLALRVAGTTCGLVDVRECQTTAAQPTRSNTKTAYPRLQRRLWSARCRLGSTTAG